MTDTFLIPCPQCNGCGWMADWVCCGRSGIGGCCGSPDQGQVLCSECNGSGSVGEVEATPEVRIIACEYCEGDGRLYGAPRPPDGDCTSTRCHYCDGTVRQEIELEPVTLEDLNEHRI